MIPTNLLKPAETSGCSKQTLNVMVYRPNGNLPESSSSSVSARIQKLSFWRNFLKDAIKIDPAFSDISISQDRTNSEQKNLKDLGTEVANQSESGEDNLTIKYINRLLAIVKSTPKKLTGFHGVCSELSTVSRLHRASFFRGLRLFGHFQGV